VTKSNPVPSIKDLALDRLHELAKEERKTDPTLTPQQAMAKAAATPAGREAYAWYRDPASGQPWPQVVEQLAKRAASYADRLAAFKAKTPSRKTNPAPTKSPADHIYASLVEQALAAAPKGRSESGAVADFLQTQPGQALHAQWNAARVAVDDVASDGASGTRTMEA
jgi:hypothetical protein